MPYKVQWCHGAPTFIAVFAEAARVFNNSYYMDRAKLAADFTWEQGILTKGMQLGHGVSGNAYMILYLYQATGDEKYLHRFLQIHSYALDSAYLTDPDNMKSYDCLNYSIFVSSVGSIAITYVDIIGHANGTRGF